MGYIKGVPKKSVVIVLAQHWKELTEKEKKEYSTRCKEVPNKPGSFVMTVKICEL